MELNLYFLLPLISALICPIVMGVMMWQMNKNMRDESGHSRHGEPMPDTPQAGLLGLRSRLQKLDAEIAEVSQIARREAQLETRTNRTSGRRRNGDPIQKQS